MASAPESPDPLIGATVAGRYVVQRRVAAGGMGVVYEAKQEPLGRRVALKVIRGDASDPVAQKRFEREARAASALQDPHVVVVHDFGVIDDGAARGGLFLAMEYVEGVTLREHLADVGRLSWGESVAIVAQISGALSAAHRAGLVHRDLKPENVMLSASGSTLLCKVLDFGLAKGTRSQELLQRHEEKPLTRSGGFVGTPGYISPEVIDGASEDPRQDVYALGVVWWELVSGRHPFPAETPMKTLVRQLHEDPPPVDAALAAKDGIPDDGLALVAAMMARHPSERPADGEAVAVALRGLRPASSGSSGSAADVDENAVTLAATRSSVKDAVSRAQQSSAASSAGTPTEVGAPPSATPASGEAVTVQGRRRGVGSAGLADAVVTPTHAEGEASSSSTSSALASKAAPPSASESTSATSPSATGTSISFARRRRKRLRERVMNAALLGAVVVGAVFLATTLRETDGPPPPDHVDAGVVPPPPAPTPPRIDVTDVVVDGIPTFGALKILREHIGEHQLRLYRSGHAELWLKGDVGSAVADRLQDLKIAADGRAFPPSGEFPDGAPGGKELPDGAPGGRTFLVIVEDVEPGRVVVKVALSDDAVVLEDAGVVHVPGGLSP